MLTINTFTPLTPLHHPLFEEAKVKVWMKRDDLTHPEIQGNKWRKLRPHLDLLKQKEYHGIVTFGGAYSNHIAATAAAGHHFGFPTIGYIRGDELAQRPEKWSHTLQQAQAHGMQLKFIDRQTYRQRHDESFLKKLQQQHPHWLILPEGGSNPLAVTGMTEVMTQLEEQCLDWTHLYTAVGTGASFAGLIRANEANKAHAEKSTNPPEISQNPQSCCQIHGIAVLNEAEYLLPQIENWIGQPTKQTTWQLHTNGACGGYGKTTAELLETQQRFEQAFQIPLDPIYTAKMVHAFLQHLKAQQIPANSRVILYHSGGLQGRRKTHALITE